MRLFHLASWAKDMSRFQTLDDYSDFCEAYLRFVSNEKQEFFVAQNEPHYIFYRYHAEGNFNITRPINRQLMIPRADFPDAREAFYDALAHIHQIRTGGPSSRLINQFIYTCQQSIGAALDALPSRESNTARKINGDLFERYIRLVLRAVGVEVHSGWVFVPIIVDGKKQFKMSYQHDLIVEEGGEVRAIGSVKTSSKDRLDKIFTDKFMYTRLTDQYVPHFAVFLNDVQRKGREPLFGINSTFLSGHFKGYTLKLNPLDGVYYCDLRPNMCTDPLLCAHIRSFDCLLTEDIWNFLE